MSEIYQAPQADLTDTEQQFDSGSLERAVQGDYQLQVGAVISEAWQKVSGTKWKFHLALGLYFLVYLLLLVAIALVFSGLGLRGELAEEMQGLPPALQILLGGGIAESLLLMVLTAPLWVGIGVMGIRRAVDGPVKARSVFSFYKNIIPLGITFILMYLLMILGFILLVLPGIYLAIAYSMALFLVIDKKLSPWQALETSRKAVSKRWFSLFGLYIVLGIIAMISAIPLGIGLIWTIPLYIISCGIAYRNMFGCEPETKGN